MTPRKSAALLAAFMLVSGCASRTDATTAIIEQNGQKRLLQKIAFTTSAAVTALATTTLDDSVRPGALSNGPMVALQSDQDFWYELRRTGATTAVTNYSGARPGVFVSAKQQEFVILGLDAVAVDLKGDSSSGTLAVFLVN